LTPPWEAGWEEAVAAWIDETFAKLQVECVGRVDHVRRRPWAALARVTTAEGDVYFKADPPSEAYEPALTEWLARARPDVVPEVLRIDADRGWLLTRDAGHAARPGLRGLALPLARSNRRAGRDRDRSPDREARRHDSRRARGAS